MKQERVSAGQITELLGHVSSKQHVTAWRKITCLCLLLELSADWGYAEAGLEVLRSIAAEDRRAFAAPELQRLEGELLLKREQPALDEARRCFGEAIGLARGRGEKSFELRAATSLARLLQRQGRREEAHATLAPVHDWFTEGLDTADLKAAKALVQELS
jgi:predicted ATPase